MKIGILTSGNLGKDTLEKIVSNYEVSFVLTDSNSVEIINLCEEHNIPFFKGNPRQGKGFEFIKKIEVDIIASINYLFLIEADIIQHSNRLTFNIHGSLLPKYRGRTPHVWSIINNEKEIGVTAHVIDLGCDTGDIISQIIIIIDENDTGNDILDKYKDQYFNLVKNVLEQVKTASFNLVKQNEEYATYFGKRTPEDGKIDWDWQKERIQNWVRAQSYPYPGAYCFVKNQKIIIDAVEKSPIGFNCDMENGTVLATSPTIIVKTPNGALALTKLRELVEVEIGIKLT